MDNRIVGPATAMRVNPGDKVEVTVNGRFAEQASYSGDVGTLLFGALGTTYATNPFGNESSTVLSQSFENAFLNLGNWGEEGSTRPQGMLNYMLLDENFELVSGSNAYGYDQIDYSAGFDPLYGPGSVDVLSLSIDNIPQNGYLYIWLSNETPNSQVYFDDLEVTLTNKSFVVAEETDYYPFGEILSQTRDPNAPVYRFGYQGEFAEEDEETGWNQFELRLYDGIVGRWLSVDPYRQYWSAYVGMGNDPVNGVDPDGGFSWFGAWIRSAGTPGSGIYKKDGEWYVAGYYEGDFNGTMSTIGYEFMSDPDAPFELGGIYGYVNNQEFAMNNSASLSFGAQVGLEEWKILGFDINLGSVDLADLQWGFTYSLRNGFDPDYHLKLYDPNGQNRVSQGISGSFLNFSASYEKEFMTRSGITGYDKNSIIHKVYGGVPSGVPGLSIGAEGASNGVVTKGLSSEYSAALIIGFSNKSNLGFRTINKN